MDGTDSQSETVGRSLAVFFRHGVRVALGGPGQAWRPRQAWQFLRTLRWQQAAAKARAGWREKGVPVPPIIIFSITHECNLECTGCYARSFQDSPAECDTGRDLSDSELGRVVAEAEELGVSFFVIAGGEPLLRLEILAIAERFPRILFLLFTNGVLIDQEMTARLARAKNVIPLLSLEGTATETDQRRGEGTYGRLMEAMARLRSKRLFFGCSLTLTSANFFTVLDDGYVGSLAKSGCRFFLFADYTPTDEATAGWVLTDEQREQVTARMRSLRKRYPALFVAVPWDEQEVGGCLSSGRGFVHINASGDLEPCPFSPYSDVNVRETSLAEALRSPFLAGLRALPELSTYTGGGCALWRNRGAVEKVLAEVRSGSEPD